MSVLGIVGICVFVFSVIHCIIIPAICGKRKRELRNEIHQENKKQIEMPEDP